MPELQTIVSRALHDIARNYSGRCSLSVASELSQLAMATVAVAASLSVASEFTTGCCLATMAVAAF